MNNTKVFRSYHYNVTICIGKERVIVLNKADLVSHRDR